VAAEIANMDGGGVSKPSGNDKTEARNPADYLIDADSRIFIRHLLSFLRNLKNYGLRPSPAKTLAVMEALQWIRVERRDEVYALLSALCVSNPDEIPLFDAAFDSFWAAQENAGGVRVEKEAPAGDKFPVGGLEIQKNGAGQPQLERKTLRYSAEEVLSGKDLATLAEAESKAVARMIRDLAQDVGLRVSRRWKAYRSGKRIDIRRSLRNSLRSGGELVKLLRKRRAPQKMRFVVLCDVSGSMDKYSRFLLEFAYGFQKSAPRVETFVFSTRLTRVTPLLRPADREEAYRRVAERVKDWSGGTRIGSCLSAYNTRYGRRYPASDTISIVLSDGWDQGDIELLEREILELKRRSRYLVWLNPLLGLPDYRPIDRGMKTALPHTDDFLDCHNFDQLKEFGRRLEHMCEE